MSSTHTPHADATAACENLPDLVRMNYFHGQLLGPADFQREQNYFRDKLRLLNRCLHGYGVICGLEVVAVIEQEMCAPHDERAKDRPPSAKVQVNCGFALDCHGNEIVLRSPRTIDVLELLSADERARLQNEECITAWLSICYQECGFQSTRPVGLDQCSVSTGCENARVREGWKLRVSLERPDEDERCEQCCSPCEDCCVLLAALKLRRSSNPQTADIDNGVRRRFGLYESTVITGISWRHGATYQWDDAAQILGTEQVSGGLEIRFSREVRVETLKPGVIDIWRLQGGRGLAGVVQHMEGEYVDLPASGYVDRVRYRDVTGERLQEGDRILIIVRGSFILDRCCRPVESAHIGGKVPLIAGSAGEGSADKTEQAKPAAAKQMPRSRRKDEARRGDDHKQEPHGQSEQSPPAEPPAPESCPQPPGHAGPWTTGTGPTFESWFFIAG
jgi:hypothetical protein